MCFTFPQLFESFSKRYIKPYIKRFRVEDTSPPSKISQRERVIIKECASVFYSSALENVLLVPPPLPPGITKSVSLRGDPILCISDKWANIDTAGLGPHFQHHCFAIIPCLFCWDFKNIFVKPAEEDRYKIYPLKLKCLILLKKESVQGY